MAHAMNAAQGLTDAAAARLAALDAHAVREARLDLAASLRMAARLGMGEGICNHFSAMLPGSDEFFLVNPYGLAFDEITAGSLLVCDLHGNVAQGRGRPEATAFHIHARVHLRHRRARAVFHTHMPNATALCLLEGDPLLWAGQTALKFWGRVAVDENYNGLALDESEGDRIAAALHEQADVLFMKNHGVMVVGDSIARAWDDLYYLERAAHVQRLAASMSRRLKPVAPDVAARTAAQMMAEDPASARAHLDSVRRRLMRSEPEFGQ
jgi:ribulose-5-phosphate 4-epimerase/fuculose-1-phosphate aldolase